MVGWISAVAWATPASADSAILGTGVNESRAKSVGAVAVRKLVVGIAPGDGTVVSFSRERERMEMFVSFAEEPRSQNWVGKWAKGGDYGRESHNRFKG